MDYTTPLISFNWTWVMQLITVLVLFLILKKFFFEKVHNFILKREDTLKDAFDNAESVNRRADEKMENYTRRIAKIEDEGREIIKAAKVKAEAQAKEIIEEANQKAGDMVLVAEKEIEREKMRALAEMRTEISTLAILAASKIMEKDLEQGDEQNKIVDKIIEEAGRAEWQN